MSEQKGNNSRKVQAFLSYEFNFILTFLLVNPGFPIGVGNDK